ncbi:putative sodium/hydrogen exchanger 3 [Colletotrichum sublineola]|uniref:Putative sodium/hydrogen exchanger 3 n=1 Tax=Colletotrichum sublineola TaxID=1173701 RepID=A0A066Y259_COLSU|nr:putative sodium/hydrogen exchanger 3 [Colletotrichum sublineola]
MVSTTDIAGVALRLFQRAAEEGDPESSDGSQKEIFAAWALFISIMLLIIAFLTSYFLQERKIEAVHETVISIFAGLSLRSAPTCLVAPLTVSCTGMTVGLLLLVTSGDSIRNLISFDYQIFFNLLLPPIILASGYELHQANFFRNMGTILTFAFAGTFLSAVVIGLILWLYALTGLESISMSFVDAISVGATLSATDPVTILAIFNSYKVDPKLYTIIFGESILNDAIAIVIFETAQKYKKGDASKLGFLSFFEGIGIFLIVFFGSMLIGVLHYAYFNMSRRTQLTTKFIFQILAQLSENFIFIYLGLALFTDNALQFRPLLIIITVCAVCAARWVAVFPLSRLINWVIRYRARRRGGDVSDELPYNYQAMLFWAGLRGAVGVALAALLTGENSYALKATVLVVVVLTVIIFGGTTARMLEILGIRTGVVDEIDSDDEFDIETFNGGQYAKRSGTGIGYTPRQNRSLSLDHIGSRTGTRPPAGGERSSYVSGSHSPNPIKRQGSLSRKNSEIERADLLSRSGNTTDSDLESDIDTSDLPPPAHREPRRRSPTIPGTSQSVSSGGLLAQTESTAAVSTAPHHVSATSAIRQLFSHGAEDAAGLFRQLDEDYIKPKLLLDGGSSSRGNGSGPGPGQV